MTHYVAAYDTESPDCLEGVRRIVQVHEQYEMPATFFMVSNLLDKQGADYTALLKNHPLFEIASHTCSHMPIADVPRFCKAGPLERFEDEIAGSKRRLEDHFECSVTGFRTPVGTCDGLGDCPEGLRWIHAAGYQYVSSVAWGPDCSLPAPLRQPFSFAAQGYPGLYEFPACGWHENLLKGHNRMGPVLLCMFPSCMPEAIPPGYVESPEEEFRYNNKPCLDRAGQDGMPLITLVWHPWSLRRMDPEMHMLDLTFRYVRENGYDAVTFGRFAAKWAAQAQ